MILHPIGDMVARIRNGQKAGKEIITTPFSTLRANVLAVLKEEGFITDFEKTEIAKNKFDIKIELKYIDGEPAIQEIAIVSKPGRRAYADVAGMPRIMNGLGIAIVSSPSGVMTDAKARTMNIGGEVLCRVI